MLCKEVAAHYSHQEKTGLPTAFLNDKKSQSLRYFAKYKYKFDFFKSR